MIERLEQRVLAEEAQECGWTEREGQSLNSNLRRGWYWGSEDFRQKLLELSDAQSRLNIVHQYLLQHGIIEKNAGYS